MTNERILGAPYGPKNTVIST